MHFRLPLRSYRLAILASAALLACVPVEAQDPQPSPSPSPTPAPPWKVSVGGGLSVTGGNTDTKSYNLAAEMVYDPHAKNVVRASALYLRTSQDAVVNANQTHATGRDEYAVNGHTFVFGEVGYQRDPFKGVDHVVAPAAGLGVKVVDRPQVVVSMDGGLGAAFEKLVGEDATTRLAVNASQRVEWKAAPTTTLFEKASALWKADDFGDAYYHAETGLALGLVKRLELKLFFADDYKTRPPVQVAPTPPLKKNDTSFLASLLFKL